MPKLNSAIIEENKLHIERAAKELFIRQGFHAAPMREIAARADVSLGNLYNYYRTKEELFASIIGRHQEAVNVRLNSMFSEIEEPFLPESLKEFGQEVKRLVGEHSDYWLLMYIDVLEFDNKHFRKMFDGLAGKLRRRYAAYFAELKRRNGLCDGVDPAVAFTAAYMQFFNYFLVEKLFGGNRHFGLSDDRVIAQLTEIFCRGVLRSDGAGLPQARNKILNGRGRTAPR